MDDILYCNSIGLIPGPKESKEGFDRRAKYCLRLQQDVLPQLFNREISTSPLLHEALPITQNLYGIRPEWVSLVFSNEKLAPWHGGAAWIFQMESDSPTAALLQLRKNFLHKETYLGLLHRKELIAHELSHIGRMMFEEPQFEEILAYRTSISWLAKNFGPLLQTSKESLLFIGSLFLILSLDIAAVIQGSYDLFQALSWLKLFPLALAFFALWRLWNNRSKLKSCLDNLKQMALSDEKANAILYRLTDQEIFLFARTTPAEIRSYIEQQQELRWQVIKAAYLS